MRRGPIIGVVGTGVASALLDELAAEVGREIARNNAVLVCGGLGGVMTAAARGAKEVGGYTIGILPGPTISDANPYIDFPVASNMGQARNAIIVQTAEVLISIGGGYGTLSEIALALKMSKGVVALRPQFNIAGIEPAETPRQAVQRALVLIRKTGGPPPAAITIA